MTGNQLSIADLDLAPKRGRPKSDNPLTSAQKQKLYRDRAKQAGKKRLLLEPFEVALIESLLTQHSSALGDSDPARAEYDVTIRKFRQLM